jgi:hypothetical protein
MNKFYYTYIKPYVASKTHWSYFSFPNSIVIDIRVKREIKKNIFDKYILTHLINSQMLTTTISKEIVYSYSFSTSLLRYLIIKDLID